MLLDGIRRLSEYATTDPEGFEKSIRVDTKIQQEAAARALKNQLAKAHKRSTELDTLIQKRYESYALGKITEKRFDTMLAAYEAEQAELEQSIAKDQQELDAFVQDEERIEKFLALTRKYTDLSELTTPMIKDFFEKIIVHAPDYSSGHRTQQVDIRFRYLGFVSIPDDLEPLTHEEQAEQDKLEAKRAKYREKYYRCKELKAQREAKAAQADEETTTETA
ncbi:MAG: DUF4368 domain-containing protein [Clostridia bacterium]|nr:DUF4368 domain-containing protein [Clostridia bacterium]